MPQTVAGGSSLAKTNIITGCVLTIAGLVAIFWVIPAYVGYQQVDEYANSPRFFPYVTAVALTLLSILLVMQNVLSMMNYKEEKAEESEENEVLGFGWNETVNLGILALGSVTYLILMKYAGFLIASTALLAVSMYFARVKKLLLVLTAVGLPIFLQQLLWYVLTFRLP